MIYLFSDWPSIDQSQEHCPVPEEAIVVRVHKYLPWEEQKNAKLVKKEDASVMGVRCIVVYSNVGICVWKCTHFNMVPACLCAWHM